MVEGSIIAIIMASHIKLNMAADATRLAPIGIHIMLIDQPPGMGMPRDMEMVK